MIKNKLVYKLLFTFKLFIFYFFICFKTYADDLNKKNEFVVLGDDNAPVKIKIFSSLTCPHCANFHTEIVPKIEKNYVKFGKVQLIFLDFPLDEAALNASKLLHCIDQKKQITFLDTIYENQSKWTNGSTLNEINNNLKEITEDLGISSNEFEKCLNNQTIENKILDTRIESQIKYSINSTPTIIINEKKFEDAFSFKKIKKRIDKLI
tara:strand:+ start:1181 stop:1804 length:624 start_codon:yes stop_codon:yes gene_type:complete